MNPALLNKNETEFFTWDGKVMVIHHQMIHTFDEAPLEALTMLRDALDNDKRATDGLALMNITNPVEQLRMYAACRYGSFNDQADFGNWKSTDDELIDCPMKYSCKGFGLVCKKRFSVEGEKLSSREVEVGLQLARGLSVDQIATASFVEPITIHSTLLHLKQKLNLPSRTAVAIFFTRNMINAL